jgi:hypothetical protein
MVITQPFKRFLYRTYIYAYRKFSKNTSQ